jgi:multicomponent Na+:H+ antiporter subunit A
VIAAAATASMAALPPFPGFIAKEADFETMRQPSLGLGAVGAGRRGGGVGVHHDLQPAIPVGAFARKGFRSPSIPRRPAAPPEDQLPGRPGDAGRGGPVLRSGAGLPGRLLDDYAETARRRWPRHYTLTLWHGFNLPLLLSVLVLRSAPLVLRTQPAAPRADGLAAAGQRRPDLRRHRPGPIGVGAVTGVTQRGSLPATQSVILSTLVRCR